MEQTYYINAGTVDTFYIPLPLNSTKCYVRAARCVLSEGSPLAAAPTGTVTITFLGGVAYATTLGIITILGGSVPGAVDEYVPDTTNGEVGTLVTSALKITRTATQLNGRTIALTIDWSTFGDND